MHDLSSNILDLAVETKVAGLRLAISDESSPSPPLFLITDYGSPPG